MHVLHRKPLCKVVFSGNGGPLLETSRDFHSRGQRSVTLIVLDKLQLIALVSPEEG